MSTPAFKPPQLVFSPLPYLQAQGSAQLSYAGFTVLASVNGPIDPSNRSQQQAEECILEVNLRENAGAGGPRERHIERLLSRTLKPLIDVRAHPRTVVQVTLQVLRTPQESDTSSPITQAESIVGILPTLVNASVLALLDANVAMTGIAVSVGVVTLHAAVEDEDEDENMEEPRVLLVDEDHILQENYRDAALHAFAFTGGQEMLLAVSEGGCDLDKWEEAAQLAKAACCGRPKSSDGMVEWVRSQVSEELGQRRRWKQSSTVG